MRGKHQSRVRGGTGKRNIPAYAGKTTTAGMVSMPAAEHPRVCGENVIPTSERPELMGTSPRMRGKPDDDVIEAVQKRNIPAYAGKTIVLRLGRRPAPEHPRVCGENDEAFKLANADGGTSPRMRGKLRQYFLRHRGLRNIPAYAGKTGQLGGMAGANLEHPRVCGENRQARARPDTPRRNIPAYAGKTSRPAGHCLT